MELNFSSDNIKPGENITLEVSTAPDSIAFISVMDKSVQLLREPNNLNIDLIESQLSALRLTPYIPSDFSFNDSFDKPSALLNLQVSYTAYTRIRLENLDRLF
jgi:hypothetical protein